MSKQIRLTNGLPVLVDDQDYDFLSQWKWHCFTGLSGIKYAKRTTDGKYMHRVVLSLTSKNEVIDHKNGDGLDNRRKNLRVCSNSQNLRNQRKPKNNKSGYKGVCWLKSAKKWHGQIVINKNRIHLGLFNCKIEAARAYNEAALKYHGEFAHLNQIPE